MAQLTDLQKVRRERQRKRLLRNLLLLGLFGLAVYVLVLVTDRMGNIDFKALFSNVQAGLDSGDGYPVQLPGGKVARFTSKGNTLTLLTDTNIYTYNTAGGQMLDEQHGMANQILVPSRDRSLLYDYGGKKVSVYSKTGFLRAMTTDNTIHNADISDNGNIALVMSSQESFSKVVVYNSRLKEIFKWHSSLPIVSLSLAPNKDAMVVGRVDVSSNGDFMSSISRFQFSQEKILAETILEGELLLDVAYNGSSIRAITDQRIILYNQDFKEVASYVYSGKTMHRIYCPNDSGLSVLVLGNFSEDKRLQMVTLDSTLNVLGDIFLDYEVIDAKADKDYVYVAATNQIDIYDATSNLLVSEQISPINHIAVISSHLYYVTNADIGVIDVKNAVSGEKPISSEPSESETVTLQEPASSVYDPNEDTESASSKTMGETLIDEILNASKAESQSE